MPLNMLMAISANCRRLLLFCLSAAVLASCASTQGNNSNSLGIEGQEDNFVEELPEVSIDALAIQNNQDLFRIGDIADIYIYNVPELTNTYPIDRQGNVHFPLIGSQKVAGLTTLELQQKLTSEYGGTYLQNPSVNVKREATTLGRFVIDGSVASPGVFDLVKPIRISTAVALAGGLSEDANQKELFLVRQIEGQNKVKRVDLKAIRETGAADLQVYPNDIVFVQESTGRRAYAELLRALPLLSTAIVLAGR